MYLHSANVSLASVLINGSLVAPGVESALLLIDTREHENTE